MLGISFKTLRAMDKGLQACVKWACIISMLFIISIAVLQVFSRFFMGFSFRWAEELIRYLCVWFAFFGGSLALRHNEFIGVSILIARLPLTGRRTVSLISKLLTLVFLLVVIRYSIDLIDIIVSRNQLSPALRIPMYLPYLSVPVGALIMIFFTFCSILLDNHEETAFAARQD